MTHGNMPFIFESISDEVMMHSKNVLYVVPANSYIGKKNDLFPFWTSGSPGRSCEFSAD